MVDTTSFSKNISYYGGIICFFILLLFIFESLAYRCSTFLRLNAALGSTVASGFEGELQQESGCGFPPQKPY